MDFRESWSKLAQTSANHGRTNCGDDTQASRPTIATLQRFPATLSSIGEDRTSPISTLGLGSESRKAGEQALAVGLLRLGIEKFGEDCAALN